MNNPSHGYKRSSGGADRLTHAGALEKQHRHGANDQRGREGDKLDLGDRHATVEKKKRPEIRLRRPDVGAEQFVGELLQHDTQTESRQDRDEQVFVDDPVNHAFIENPTEEEQQHGREGDTEQRMDSSRVQKKSGIAAEHDELALGDVDDVHYAPNQSHAVGSERENRPDQHSVQ